MASDVVFLVVYHKLCFMLFCEKKPINMYSKWVINKVGGTSFSFQEMGSHLRNAEEKQTSDDENVSKSIEEFLGIAHDLEDIVDPFVLGRTRRRRSVFIRCITLFKGLKAHHNLWKGMMQIEERISAWKLKIVEPHPSANNNEDTNNPESQAPASSSNSSKQQHNDQVQVHLLELPSHLRPCLLYLGMFPREMDIPVRRLFHLWLAEDFLVKRSHIQNSGVTAPEVSEDLAVEYLEDLEKRGMVRVSRSVSDASPKRCCMTGKFYDIILPKAEKVGFFHIHKNIASSSSSTDRDHDHQSQTPPPQFAVRRVAEYANIKDYPADSELYVQYLRSYTSFNFQKKDMQALQIGNFVSKIIGKRGYSLLTVLDLERVYKPALPEELGYLYHLRYLGLRWTFVDALPSSARNLIHLQTLDLKHTYIRSLPVSFWNLHFLRHLYLNDIRVARIWTGFKDTRSIQTLSGIFVDRETLTLLEGYIKFRNNLKKLGLTGRLSTHGLGHCIAKLTSLQSLKLRSTHDDEMARPSSLHLVSLVGLKNLTKLYLLGKLANLDKDPLEFPPSLRDLTLSCSRLNVDPMLMLGRLPHLTVLRLLANSYSGSKMVSQQSEFGSLRILQLWVLEDLEEWVVEQGAMQNLQKLEIRRCHKLKSVPETLINSTTLEELTLTNMPEEFVAETQILQIPSLEFNAVTQSMYLKTNPWNLIIR